MKKKYCKACKKVITSDIAVMQVGYLSTKCRPCKRIEAKEYARKRKKLLENTFWEY